MSNRYHTWNWGNW